MLLATVLFLVGIGSTFKVRQVRVVLASVGAVMLVTAVALIAQQPRPLTKGNHCRATTCLIHTQQGPEMIGLGQVPLPLLRPELGTTPADGVVHWMDDRRVKVGVTGEPDMEREAVAMMSRE